jgi:hypothetical protein
MAIDAGRHPFGTDRGRILLRTLRDGLAAHAGHDLTMEATRWSGELRADDTGSPTGLEVRIDMGSLEVLEGSGGIKQLTDSGTLELAGRTRPARLQVSRTGADAYRATASVVQSDFGSTPYRAFLGSLKVRDAANVEVRLDLSDHPEARGDLAQ